LQLTDVGRCGSFAAAWRSWNSYIYFQPRIHGASWRSLFAPYKYSYLLTYLQT